MWRFDHKTRAILALVTLASLVGIVPVDAQSEAQRDRNEYRSSEGARQAAQRAAGTRQSRTYPARARATHTAARAEASYARLRQVANDHRELVGRGIREPRPAAVSAMGKPISPVAAECTRSPATSPGARSTSFVMATPQRHGRAHYSAGSHEPHLRQRRTRLVCARLPTPCLAPVRQSVRVRDVRAGGAVSRRPTTPGRSPHGRVRSAYSWGWEAQPWYPIYGVAFTPYPVYTSPDLWMTDYIIAQSMQTAYQAQTAAPAPQPAPQGAPAAPAPDFERCDARCTTQRRGGPSAAERCTAGAATKRYAIRAGRARRRPSRRRSRRSSTPRSKFNCRSNKPLQRRR